MFIKYEAELKLDVGWFIAIKLLFFRFSKSYTYFSPSRQYTSRLASLAFIR